MIDDGDTVAPDGVSEEAPIDPSIPFTPIDLEPLLDAWRGTVGNVPPSTVRVTLDERFNLFLQQPEAWEPHGWPRRFDLVDVTSEAIVSRLTLPEGWRAEEIVPGCAYVYRSLHSTLIRSVEPGGTMDRAGLVAGDRLRAIDGTPVATEDDVRDRLALWLAEKKPLFAKRREVEITYERAGKSAVARVIPGTIQSPAGFIPALGYVTDTEESDVVTPSELVYLAIEAVRQLAGAMPAQMRALVIAGEPVPAAEPEAAKPETAAPAEEHGDSEVPAAEAQGVAPSERVAETEADAKPEADAKAEAETEAKPNSEAETETGPEAPQP
jgi:membrane-associated protease RseP (regulator of RpoE activity)